MGVDVRASVRVNGKRERNARYVSMVREQPWPRETHTPLLLVAHGADRNSLDAAKCQHFSRGICCQLSVTVSGASWVWRRLTVDSWQLGVESGLFRAGF